MKNTDEKITKQEILDRRIASICLNDLCRDNDAISLSGTPILYAVDIIGDYYNNKKKKKIRFNVEIKERNKNKNTLKKYPFAELKEKKLNNMLSVTSENTRLYYMVLLNKQYCLIFDLKKINFDKIKKINWIQKKTQYDDNSEYIVAPTYLIPYSLASNILPISQLYTNNNINN